MIRFKVIILLVSLLAAVSMSAEYKVTNFRGGLNVADSADIGVDQYLLGQNLMINPFSVESRHGYTTWNTTQIDTFPIDQIFLYEPYPGIERFIFVSNGFIYKSETLTPPAWDTAGTDTSWDTRRISRTESGAQVLNDTTFVTADPPTWWYSYLSKGDYISFADDSSEGEYAIDILSSISDSALQLTSDYQGADDNSTDFTVYKKIHGNASFYQNGSLLYISDSRGYPIVYDDTTYWFLALVDSGQVNDVLVPADSAFLYNEGRVKIMANSNIVHGQNGAEFNYTNCRFSSLFILNYRIWHSRNNNNILFTGRWASEIINIDSVNNTLELAFPVSPTTNDELNINIDLSSQYIWYEYQKYEIVEVLRPCSFDTDSIIVDASKNWYDDLYGDQFLTGLQFVTSNDGFDGTEFIYCNNDSTFSIEVGGDLGTIDNDYYYIFSYLPQPYQFVRETLQLPYFSQITFNNSQLLAFGVWHPDSALWWPDTVWTAGHDDALDRIWYSAYDIPSYIKEDYHFDLDPTEDISTFFKLRNFLYCATNSSIWQISGSPSTAVISGNLSVSKIVDNFGIDDIDNWCQANIETIYFIENGDLYRFNGVRPEPLGFNIKPIIDKYRNVNCVMGYFGWKVWISWPDSNVTYVYDEVFNAFTGPMTFGMDCMNQQSADIDTNIFFFGIADTLGFIGYWPNNTFADVGPIQSVAFTCIYESGNQSYGDFSRKKRVTKITWPMLSPSIASIKLYSDQDSLVCDSSQTTETGNIVQRSGFDKYCEGEYFRTKIIANAGSRLLLRGYTVEWEYAVQPEE